MMVKCEVAYKTEDPEDRDPLEIVLDLYNELKNETERQFKAQEIYLITYEYIINDLKLILSSMQKDSLNASTSEDDIVLKLEDIRQILTMEGHDERKRREKGEKRRGKRASK